MNNEIREQLETLLIQNFSDAWESYKQQVIIDTITESKENGPKAFEDYSREEAELDIDWEEARLRSKARTINK